MTKILYIPSILHSSFDDYYCNVSYNYFNTRNTMSFFIPTYEEKREYHIVANLNAYKSKDNKNNKYFFNGEFGIHSERIREYNFTLEDYKKYICFLKQNLEIIKLVERISEIIKAQNNLDILETIYNVLSKDMDDEEAFDFLIARNYGKYYIGNL